MGRLKVAVIGVGGMGIRHARIFAEMPDVDLYGLVDRDPVRLREVAQRYGVEHISESFAEILNLEEVDIVDICLPDELHFAPVKMALEAGKHVFLEKPMATNLDEAEAMVRLSKQYPQKFMVGHLLRFDPRYAQVKAAIERGELGDIVYVVSHRNSPHHLGPRKYRPGTSLTMHVGVHDLDLIHWYLDSEVESVSASSVSKVLAPRDMDDAVAAVIKFANGTIASVNYSWVLPEKYPIILDARMEIVGTKGAAYVGNLYHDGVVMITKDAMSNPFLLSPEVNGRLRGALYEELRCFVDCVQNDLPVPIPPSEAIKSVRTARWIVDTIADKV
jgi:predicted dehydrogenase